MASILDYIAWRGDLPLYCSPWTPVDSLIMANIVYNDLGSEAESSMGIMLRDIQPSTEPDTVFARQWRSLLDAAANTVRYGSIRLHDFVNVVDDQREMQFSAVTANLPDGRTCICFRGTDTSIVGWKEDFTMAFETPVPAQMEALTYLERIALRTVGDLIITGHSKGGNLAIYASAHASSQAQSRICSVYSFDGPGLDEDTMSSEGYRRISRLVHSVIPQSSVVGLLLTYHPDYTVVASNATGFWQHDAFTWQLDGPRFLELGEVDRDSQLLDQTVHDWLRSTTPKQRELFVDTLFGLLEATGAHTLTELKADKLRSALAIITAGQAVDSETTRMLLRLAGRFVSIGMGNLWDAVTQKTQGLIRDALNELEQQHNQEE